MKTTCTPTWRIETRYNKCNVRIAHILCDGIKVAHIHTTYHPTIPYEVYWDDSKKSQRAKTHEECVDIVKAALLKNV